MPVVKAVLWILLAAVLLLLILPVSLEVNGKGKDWRLRLRVLFFRLQLYPQAKKKTNPPKSEKKPAAKQAAAEKSPAKKKKVTFRQIIELAQDILHSVGKPARMIFKGFTLYHVRLCMVVCEEEPDQTAIAYGKYNAFIYGALATLKNWIRVKDTSLRIIPDFTEEGESLLELEARLKIRPITLLAAVVVFGIGFLRCILRRPKANSIQEEQQHDNDTGTSTCTA